MTIRGEHFMQGAAMNQRRGDNLIGMLQNIMSQNKEQQRFNEKMELAKKAKLDEQRRAAMTPESILAKASMSGVDSLTPQEKGMLKSYDIQKTSQMGTDALGNVFQKNRSVFDMLNGSPSSYGTAPMAGPIMQQAQAGAAGLPELDMTTYSDGTPIQLSAEGIPVLDGSQLNMSSDVPDIGAALNAAGVSSRVSQSPAIQAEMAKGLMQAEIDKASRAAQRQEEKMAAEPKAFQIFKNTQFEIRDAVNKAKEVRDMVSGKSAGLVGQATGWVGGTKARDLQAALKKLKGIGTLDTLKKAKAEGVSFGATSEKELELIGSSVAALDQAQSPDTLRAAVDEYIAKMERMPQVIAEDYKGTYGAYPEGYATPEKAAPSVKRRRYNPQTGAFE